MASKLLVRREMASRILLMEDKRDISEMLAACLRVGGYQISTAENSAEGIKKAGKEKPNVILMEVLLPDMNAVEAILKLKQDPATANIPVVVLTAVSSESWKSQAIRAGAADYLTKPIALPVLLNVIGKIIGPRAMLTER